MNITRLLLKNFRNYGNAEVEPSPGLNLLWGPNAAGKTNALEAIMVLATGRSQRAGRDFELVKWGEQGFYLKGLTASGSGAATIEVGYETSGQRKIIRVNGNPKKMGALLGHLRVVSFFPDDVYIVKGAPALRRRLIDVLLSQDSSAYYYRLVEYQKALLQRNTLLRQWAGGRLPDELVEPWDLQLARSGGFIIARRAEALAVVGADACEAYGRIAPGERLSVAYVPSVPASAGEEASAVAEKMLLALRSTRGDDLRRGATGVGPHRDDLSVLIDGADARQFASQGQQRSAVLALKAAEIEFLKRRGGEQPVLLLDDVLSELDDQRQACVVKQIAAETQSFLTCADPREAGGLGVPSAVFRVLDGRIEKG